MRIRIPLAVMTVLFVGVGTANAAPTVPTAPAAPHRDTAAATYTPAPCNTGQQDKSRAQCFAMVRTGSNHVITADADGPLPTALGPADIQGAYHLPDTGDGETVAVIDAYGDSRAEADLAVFRSHYGLPACTTANGCFTKVDQDGGTLYPPDSPEWAVETSLDLDAVSAACPKCHIMLVEGINNTVGSLGTAVATAVALGAKYVSNSYGIAGEMPDEQTVDYHYDHPGVVVTASTGDTGGVINWPASNPHVVAVGGTTLARNAATPRGWDETAWSSGGSGCSQYEPRPDYQQGLQTGCALRANADISAVADPASGLAVYDSLDPGGWLQVGGTSLSAPLVAAMYALAGTPAPGTYPVTYPYAQQGNGLFDITSGSNGTCGSVLCNAGTGWDGPTGLGTPNGVGALTVAERGNVTGTVTNSATHALISGATLTATNSTNGNTYHATADAQGHYDLAAPVGTYDVTASMFGYTSAVSKSVVVTEGQTSTVDLAIRKLPTSSLSGTVTDGSGHHWPIYAKISIDGYPGAVFTDPYTGHYSVDLPQQTNYTLHVTSAVLPGYQATDVPVEVGTANASQNVALAVIQDSCTTPGYAYRYTGPKTSFEGWTASTPKDGWTNLDGKGNGEVWQFDNPGGRDNYVGDDGQFAIVDSDHYGNADSQDTSLVSPVADLTDQANPEVEFDSFVSGVFVDPIADVDLSLDGGLSWTNVWRYGTTTISQLHQRIAIPQAAGKSSVRVRFHYAHVGPVDRPYMWEVDNVFIGDRTCVPTAAGIVAGVVTDDNTGDHIDGASIASNDRTDEVGVSSANPNDAALPHGYYWLASSVTGKHDFTAADGRYTPAHASVNVAADRVTRRDWTLQAGHLSVTPASVAATERMGDSATRTVRLTNDGTKPVHVTLGEQSAAFTPMSDQRGAPLQQLKGHFTPASMLGRGGAQSNPQGELREPTPYVGPWTDIADYPLNVWGNAVAYNASDGRVYSVGGGWFKAYAESFVYDPAAQRWNSIARAPHPLMSSSAAFIDGTMYVVGGWNEANANVTTVYAYHPSTNTWSQVAYLPEPLASASVAVLGGRLYVIGGCEGNCAPTSSSVYRYDPKADHWTRLADYPTPVSYAACAGIADEIVCAGGINADTNETYKSTFAYEPDTDSWTPRADLPYDNWAMSVGSANGKLQVVAGVTNGTSTVTNQAAQYDPASDTWGALPNANNAEYRGGGACGMYQIGGLDSTDTPMTLAQTLPGYDRCQDGANVPWLSESATELDLAAGKSATVTVTIDSLGVSQPGDYGAELSIGTDTPYVVAPVRAAVHVRPPAAWGKIAGTVTDASTGEPAGGATVEICTMYSAVSGDCGPVTYTLKTDASGQYQLWLNKGYNPLQVIAAKDDYTQQVRIVKITKGTTTTVNFALSPS